MSIERATESFQSLLSSREFEIYVPKCVKVGSYVSTYLS